jgi:hypothetical protein
MSKHNKAIKNLKCGIELELFTLDEKGYVINGANQIIKRVKKEFPEVLIQQECAQNLIELITSPNLEIPHAIFKVIDDLEKVLIIAKKEKIILYACGTYPGIFTPKIYKKARYTAQQKIIGKERFLIAGRCAGLHLHYSLPWGVFDEISKIIKPLINSKNKQSMVNIYNLCIAMDPALTTLAQSSPFYQGQHIAKDSRVVVYRGGDVFKYPNGLYADLPKFGALQGYKTTNTDILHLISERFEHWKKIIKRVGYDFLTFTKHGSILESSWNPVRINAHGTMEIRGMDINYPEITIAIGIIAKYVIKEIQEKYLIVESSDKGIESPFKRDGNKIFIPPDSYVINTLQPKAAYEGLKNDDIYKYCLGLINLAKEFIPAEKNIFLESINKIMAERKTISDKIIEKAEAMGINIKKEMSSTQAANLALVLSSDLYNEISIARNKLIEFL